MAKVRSKPKRGEYGDPQLWRVKIRYKDNDGRTRTRLVTVKARTRSEAVKAARNLKTRKEQNG